MYQLYWWPQSTDSRLARIRLALHDSFNREQIPGPADREELDDCVTGGRLHACRVYPMATAHGVVDSLYIRLAPHEVRKVRVRTIPLSGIKYPVQLTVKS